MKSAFRAFLTCILVGCLTLVFVANFGVVHAATDVSGIIGSDATWTKAGSPYSLTGNMLVGNGATLTIEAGVTVNLNDFYIMVNGTLRAKGTETERIQFNGGEITFTPRSSDWNEQTGSGSIIENANLESAIVDITSASPKIIDNSILTITGSGNPIVSRNIIHDGITVFGGSVSYNDISGGVSVKGNSVVSNNTISGGIDVSHLGSNDKSNSPVISNNNITGGGIRIIGYALISHNIISGCTVAIQSYTMRLLVGDVINAYPLIERNLITHNTHGITIALSRVYRAGTVAPTIRNNTITYNSVGIYIESITNYNSTPTIIYNNIHDNDYSIKITEYVQNEINATYNWWGISDISAINQTIYDYKYDFNLPKNKVVFVPFLTEPNPEEMSTPIPEFPSWLLLPLFLVATFVVLVFRKRLVG
jgi:hypothetical protein